MRQIRFRFDGQPINETDTPAQVGTQQVGTQGLLRPVCGSCQQERSRLRVTDRCSYGTLYIFFPFFFSVACCMAYSS